MADDYVSSSSNGPAMPLLINVGVHAQTCDVGVGMYVQVRLQTELSSVLCVLGQTGSRLDYTQVIAVWPRLTASLVMDYFNTVLNLYKTLLGVYMLT